MCEFCGCENGVDDSVQRVCVGQRAGVHSDDLYLPNLSDDDYQNLEDTLVIFCVDISGSMSVTTEVCACKGSGGRLIRILYSSKSISALSINTPLQVKLSMSYHIIDDIVRL